MDGNRWMDGWVDESVIHGGSSISPLLSLTWLLTRSVSMPSLPAPLKLTPFHTVFPGTAVPDALTVIAEQQEREREDRQLASLM